MKKRFLVIFAVLFVILLGSPALAASEDVFWTAFDYYGNPLTQEVDTKHIRLFNGLWDNNNSSQFSFSDTYRQNAKTTFSKPINGYKAIFTVAMPWSDSVMPNAMPTISISGGNLPSSRVTRSDTLYGLTVANPYNGDQDILRYRLAFYIVDFTNYTDRDITWFNIGYLGSPPNASFVNSDWYVNYNLLSFSLLSGSTDVTSLLQLIEDRLWLGNTFASTSMTHLQNISDLLKDIYSMSEEQTALISEYNDKISALQAQGDDLLSRSSFERPSIEFSDFSVDTLVEPNVMLLAADSLGSILSNNFIMKLMVICVTVGVLSYFIFGKRS